MFNLPILKWNQNRVQNSQLPTLALLAIGLISAFSTVNAGMGRSHYDKLCKSTKCVEAFKFDKDVRSQNRLNFVVRATNDCRIKQDQHDEMALAFWNMSNVFGSKTWIEDMRPKEELVFGLVNQELESDHSVSFRLPGFSDIRNPRVGKITVILKKSGGVCNSSAKVLINNISHSVIGVFGNFVSFKRTLNLKVKSLQSGKNKIYFIPVNQFDF